MVSLKFQEPLKLSQIRPDVVTPTGLPDGASGSLGILREDKRLQLHHFAVKSDKLRKDV